MLKIYQISKTYGTSNVLNDIEISISKSEYFFILGPSGCGKSTLLKIIAGIEAPDNGQLLFNGKEINNLPPEKRPFNMVFQNYALFPHLNVFGNIAFGLKLQKLAKDEIQRKVRDALSLVSLNGFDNRKISQLSGGEQQRVAIARALVNEPEILLLDEPVSALDAKLKSQLLKDIRAIKQKLSSTFIHVTHDQSEALALADRIAVMNDGRIEQVGSPEEIYNNPKNRFVADFIGKINFIDDAVITITKDGFAEGFIDENIIKTEEKAAVSDANYALAVRPEHVMVFPKNAEIPDSHSNRLSGVLKQYHRQTP